MKLSQTYRLGALTLFFIFLSFLSFSQEAVLQGVVIDDANSEPLIGATVQIGDTGTTSDFEGRYRLSAQAGEVTVKLTYVGYETLEQTMTLVAGENKLNFSLLEAATILNTATVTSGKFEKPLGEVTVSLEVIKPTLLESNNATSVDAVLGKVSGVEILDGQANIRGGSGYSYGAGSRVLLLVDDVPILQPDAGFPNWNDVPVENIEQIEIVKGAASALYGSSAMNGIINIRTGYAKSEPETRFSSFYTGYDSFKDETKSWWKANDTINTPGADTLNAPSRYGASALHKQKFGNFDLVVGAFYLNSTGFRKDEFN
ncbi:MAG: outer membrane receptor protein involved in Fe transport, partial [Saprospiraceae bacterium]